jgi:hypothetical protein
MVYNLEVVTDPVRFARILKLRPGPRRTAALAAWLQALYPDGAASPVLVGGAAVELYTSGAYATSDLDFVGEVPESVAARLREAGFERRGRHWVHEPGNVFFEFPGRQLAPAAEPVRVETAAPEALLADRLAAWKFWRSEADGIGALLLLRARGEQMQTRLAARCARELEVEEERRRLVRFERGLRGRSIGEEEVRKWLARGRKGR